MGLEKSRQQSNCIKSLKNERGENKIKDEEILSIAHTFYSNLYTSNKCNQEDMIAWFDNLEPENVLSEKDSQCCEGKISMIECKEAILKMKKNKSPGLDGICIEFYKTFWPIIGKLLVEVYNECNDNESLTESQNLAVISLIF